MLQPLVLARDGVGLALVCDDGDEEANVSITYCMASAGPHLQCTPAQRPPAGGCLAVVARAASTAALLTDLPASEAFAAAPGL